MDIYHNYGNDLVVGVNGDLRLTENTETSEQRIIRRLLTPLKSYISHTDYGAGLGQYIGLPLSIAIEREIKSVITSQLLLESSVAKSPPPEIQITPSLTGLVCFIQYTESASKALISLNFQVSR